MHNSLYESIKDDIKQKINNGTYKQGDKIPTEMELCKLFNVSRQTANKALRDLVMEGYVQRFPRSGTFVKTNLPQTSVLELKNIALEVQSRNNIYTNKLVELKTIKADQSISDALHVVKDEEVYMSKMVHYENSVPIRFDIRYVKPSLAKDYINQNFKTITPSKYLTKHCPVEKVENIIEAKLVDNEILKYLSINVNEPCLKISRIVTSNGQVATYSMIYYPSSRYKLVSVFNS